MIGATAAVLDDASTELAGGDQQYSIGVAAGFECRLKGGDARAHVVQQRLMRRELVRVGVVPGDRHMDDASCRFDRDELRRGQQPLRCRVGAPASDVGKGAIK